MTKALDNWRPQTLGIQKSTGRWFIFESRKSIPVGGIDYDTVQAYDLRSAKLSNRFSIATNTKAIGDLRRLTKDEVGTAIREALKLLRTKKTDTVLRLRGSPLKDFYEKLDKKISTNEPVALAEGMRDLGAILRPQRETSLGYGDRPYQLFERAAWALAHISQVGTGQQAAKIYDLAIAQRLQGAPPVNDAAVPLKKAKADDAPYTLRSFEAFDIAIFERNTQRYCVNGDSSLVLSQDAYTLLDYLYEHKGQPVDKQRLMREFFSERSRPIISLNNALQDMDTAIVSGLGLTGQAPEHVIERDKKTVTLVLPKIS